MTQEANRTVINMENTTNVDTANFDIDDPQNLLQKHAEKESFGYFL